MKIYFDAGMFLQLSEQIQEKILGYVPIKRPGRIEELLYPLGFFLSEHSSYITGQTITLDGGFSIASLIS